MALNQKGEGVCRLLTSSERSRSGGNGCRRAHLCGWRALVEFDPTRVNTDDLLWYKNHRPSETGVGAPKISHFTAPPFPLHTGGNSGPEGNSIYPRILLGELGVLFPTQESVSPQISVTQNGEFSWQFTKLIPQHRAGAPSPAGRPEISVEEDCAAACPTSTHPAGAPVPSMPVCQVSRGPISRFCKQCCSLLTPLPPQPERRTRLHWGPGALECDNGRNIKQGLKK